MFVSRLFFGILTCLFLFIQPAFAAKVYWSSRSTRSIQRANLDGTQKEDVLTGLSNNYGLAIDELHGKIYWSDVDNGIISCAEPRRYRQADDHHRPVVAIIDRSESCGRTDVLGRSGQGQAGKS